MRFTSRVPSLQRRLKEPSSLENLDAGYLALLDELVDPGDTLLPPGGPRPPGARFFVFRDDVTKNTGGQNGTETDKFSLGSLAALLRRALPRLCPVP